MEARWIISWKIGNLSLLPSHVFSVPLFMTCALLRLQRELSQGSNEKMCVQVPSQPDAPLIILVIVNTHTVEWLAFNRYSSKPLIYCNSFYPGGGASTEKIHWLDNGGTRLSSSLVQISFLLSWLWATKLATPLLLHIPTEVSSYWIPAEF